MLSIYLDFHLLYYLFTFVRLDSSLLRPDAAIWCNPFHKIWKSLKQLVKNKVLFYQYKITSPKLTDKDKYGQLILINDKKKTAAIKDKDR